MTATLIILLLLLLNALFVLAEFALLAAPKTIIEGRANQGEKLARKVLDLIEDPKLQDRYIGTAQLGITLASLGLGMYGEHVLANWFFQQFEYLGLTAIVGIHAAATILSISVLTFLHIVLGEMIPKSIALQNSETPMMIIARPMIFINFLLYPFVAILNWISYFLLKICGIKREEASSRFYTPDELEMIVEKSQEVGLIHKDSGQVIKDLLKFGDLTAYSAMTPRVHVAGIPVGADYAKLREIIGEDSHTRYPVYDENLDHIVGVIHIKEILSILINKNSISADAVRSIPYIPENTPLDSVFNTMRNERAQMIVVMDEHGGTSGIITIEDLFEEIVGEIEEGNNETPDEEDPSTIIVVGTERLDEVAESLGSILEHEDVETVSGLVLSLLGRPPVIGDKVHFQGLEFKVLEIEGHGVSECRVRIIV